jgi:hypothetical protein
MAIGRQACGKSITRWDECQQNGSRNKLTAWLTGYAVLPRKRMNREQYRIDSICVQFIDKLPYCRPSTRNPKSLFVLAISWGRKRGQESLQVHRNLRFATPKRY